MKTIKLISAAIILIGLATSCKPTEKGYAQAYKAAISKRTQEDPEEDILTGGHRLLTEEATNWKVIAGDSLALEHKFIKPADGGKWPESGPYRIAVAKFRMTTNAKSILQDLTKKKSQLTPVIATDGKDSYYIIAGSATYLDSLSNVLGTFKKEHPGFRYIGLTPERPVVIVGR